MLRGRNPVLPSAGRANPTSPPQCDDCRLSPVAPQVCGARWRNVPHRAEMAANLTQGTHVCQPHVFQPQCGGTASPVYMFTCPRALWSGTTYEGEWIWVRGSLDPANLFRITVRSVSCPPRPVKPHEPHKSQETNVPTQFDSIPRALHGSAAICLGHSLGIAARADGVINFQRVRCMGALSASSRREKNREVGISWGLWEGRG